MKFMTIVLAALIWVFADWKPTKSAGQEDQEMRGRLEESGSAYMMSLKSALLREIKSGFDHAVAVCSDSARELALTMEQRYGVSIRRTSRRYRNPSNAPTGADLKILEYFERLHATGTRIDTVTVFEQFQEGGRQYQRLAKPILVTSRLCLNCHGGEGTVEEETRAAILRIYPEDKAQGYQVGDLRGALIVSAVIP